MLVKYLKTINLDDETGRLLSKEDAGPSKKPKRSKNDAKATPEKRVHESKQKKSPQKQTKPEEQVSTVVIEPVEPLTDDHVKETIPSNSGVFQRLKHIARGPRKSKDGSSRFSPSNVHKPQITHQGVLIREVPIPVSPSSKKRRAEDLAKHISKKTKKKRKLVIQEESSEEEIVPETPETILPK
ncbi:unnamed protein product [Lactuca virosa]|uniref:Uncharacterized protein n=1 Tax=Lactuca virosa TaxID=75947 RepID=A0AAU9LGA6_9ASTR|nr:unnamed protein product [Lactuca virosa]